MTYPDPFDPGRKIGHHSAVFPGFPGGMEADRLRAGTPPLPSTERNIKP